MIVELRDQAKKGVGFVKYVWPKPCKGDTPKVSYAEMIPGTQFWVGTGVYLDNIAAHKATLEVEMDHLVFKDMTEMGITTGLIFAGIAVLTLLISVGINKSLKQMIDSFQDIAEGEGDLTKRIEINSKDELAELASWFNTFLGKLQGIIKQVATNAGHVDDSASGLNGAATQMTATINEIAQNAESARGISDQAVSQVGAFKI